MLLPRTELEAAYEQIKVDASSAPGACTIVIFVAPDCDAMCACRILTAKLRADGLSYQVKPVQSYGDIRSADETVFQDNEELRSVVMFNCGAPTNLARVLVNLPEPARCYVVDSHRPIHLANVYAGQKVVVLGGDEATEWDGMPSDGDDLSGREDSSDESGTEVESGKEEFGGEGDDTSVAGGSPGRKQSGQSDEESEERFGSESGSGSDTDPDDEERKEARRQRRRKRLKRQRSGSKAAGTTAAQAGEGANDENVDPNVEAAAGSGSPSKGTPSKRNPKRLRRNNEADAAAAARADRRRRLQQYYGGGSFHGEAAAVLMYEMAATMGKDTNDMLWLTIVGQTDLLVRRQVDDEMYNYFTHRYKTFVTAKNRDAALTIAADDGTPVQVAEPGRIVFSPEYRFLLFRHWSLYDAMYYSNYVASRLGVWRDAGRRRLDELLAKMGLSLEQCRQKYPFMASKLRRRLRDQLLKWGPEYQLDDALYGSFVRACGFKTPISAADIASAVTALVEHRQFGPSVVAQAALEANGGDAGEAGSSSGGGADSSGGQGGEAWLDSFNEAYDALAGRKAKPMQRGLDLSMSLQRAVLQMAVNMVEKGLITPLKYFRYAYLHAEEADQRLFVQPLALQRLANFLIDMHRENGKWSGPKKSRPLVILAERGSSFLVVGMTCPEKPGDVLKNRFGARFSMAARGAQANVRHDRFDDNVIEVDKDHVQPFLEALHDTFSVR